MSSRSATAIGGFLLLTLRGILIWVYVPVGTLVWLLTYIRLHRPLGEFLGWLDLNVAFVLQRSVLRPFFPSPTQARVPVSKMSTVRHRIGILDPY